MFGHCYGCRFWVLDIPDLSAPKLLETSPCRRQAIVSMPVTCFAVWNAVPSRLMKHIREAPSGDVRAGFGRSIKCP